MTSNNLLIKHVQKEENANNNYVPFFYLISLPWLSFTNVVESQQIAISSAKACPKDLRAGFTKSTFNAGVKTY